MARPPALAASVGSVSLRNPVMTAAGTGGHGAELSAYFDLSSLGAVVVKSLSAEAWAGNPAPRVHAAGDGMINSVGLQNPGVEAWVANDLPALRAAGATVVASIWGFTVEAYEKAAEMLAGVDGVVAVEVNVSCPNVEDRRRMFAHDRRAAAEVVHAARAAGLPIWAKLSPNVTDIGEIASAVYGAGAEAITLINTVMGMVIDVEARRPLLGGGGGGLSGRSIHAVAVRAVWDCHAAFPDRPVVGVGGVSRGVDAVELLLAGASAVQVGTATFADPRAPVRVLRELERWCRRHQITSLSELIGAAHA